MTSISTSDYAPGAALEHLRRAVQDLAAQIGAGAGPGAALGWLPDFADARHNLADSLASVGRADEPTVGRATSLSTSCSVSTVANGAESSRRGAAASQRA